MGGGYYGPAEAGALHQGEQPDREEGLAAAGVTTEHKGGAIGRSDQPGGEGGLHGLLFRGEGMIPDPHCGKGAHPTGLSTRVSSPTR